MRTTKPRQEPIREPVQERSQKRVALILEAARSMIEQKGTAGTKMSDIAETAGVSIGSIYQYFPNKKAVVSALAESILAANTEQNEEVLSEPPKSLVQLSHITTKLLEQYYELQRQDPIVRDIWAGYAKEKELQASEQDDNIKNRDYIFEISKHLFREQEYERAKLALLIIINFGAAAVSLAIYLGDKDGRRAMDDSIAMLYTVWETSILPLGHKN